MLNVSCGREFHIAYMRTQSSSFEAVKKLITSKTLTNRITLIFNRTHKANMQAKEERHVFVLEEVSNIPYSLWVCNILLKESSMDALKEGNNFGLQHFTHVPVVLFRLLSIRSSRDRPSYEIAPQTIYPNVRPV
ncbi:hypothetical protein TNCV_3514521 [Trichonephila clavipes]|nr:hypothetical protein TNCV_3514521 [Trichonephila clavipes]